MLCRFQAIVVPSNIVGRILEAIFGTCLWVDLRCWLLGQRILFCKHSCSRHEKDLRLKNRFVDLMALLWRQSLASCNRIF